MKLPVLMVVMLTITHTLTAQINPEDKKNVVISKSVRQFSFVKGNSINPVQIKEESDRTYTCNNYRTDIPIVEFYNDMLPLMMWI